MFGCFCCCFMELFLRLSRLSRLSRAKRRLSRYISMSIHIGAQSGDIAESILLPGDPLRAKFIAEQFLEDAVCYNDVRGMYGFTGSYKGKRVSVQGTGMGIPSISIYVHELLAEYGVKTLIRIGTCGSIQPELTVRDVILAIAASTDSNVNNIRFNGMNYAPAASFALLQKAWKAANQKGIPATVGPILTDDTFYADDPSFWKVWAEYGVLGIEMETAALYTLAAKFRAEALSIVTVSDDMITGKQATSEERQMSFTQMMELALEIAA